MRDDITPEPYRHLQEQIEACRRAFESGGGNYAALLDALAYCHEADTCPAWIVNAVRSIITTDIDEGSGATAHWFPGRSTREAKNTVTRGEAERP